MFTGLIEAVGVVVSVRKARGSARLRVRAGFESAPIDLGESVAVDGICLTAARVLRSGFEADLGAETLSRSTAGGWRPGRRVNLERALAAGDRFGGHMVQGHVDGCGTVSRKVVSRGQTTLRVDLPAPLRPLVAEKGSIAVDGVSLTVSALSDSWFEVALIPHTLASTNLADRRAGDRVNLEIDLIARYLARLLEASGPARAPRD